MRQSSGKGMACTVASDGGGAAAAAAAAADEADADEDDMAGARTTYV
jgi:hypothetical protein